jgi:hypothetical protein
MHVMDLAKQASVEAALKLPKLMVYLRRILRQSKHQIADIRLLRSKGRNGSLADLSTNISLMSASGRKADVPSWSIL